jgi:DNA-binding NarL/FixJ family response regulator
VTLRPPAILEDRISETALPRRELVTLLAYVRCGSHKKAAFALGISESTSRQRLSSLLARVGAKNAAQAVWRLRSELAAEIDRTVE